LKVPFNAKTLGADLISISSHKIHGPKGAGALYISPRLKSFPPLLIGGGQESGMRSGTENTIGIAGFGAACAAAQGTLRADLAHMTQLRSYLEQRLGEHGEITLNLPRGNRAPHIVNLTLPDIKSETMLNFLSGKSLDEINKTAFRATVLAHNDGDVPNLVIEIDDRSAYSFGYLVYFFELACAISGYMLGVNPFDQPGVESYKKNMFALLGKPGYEEMKKALEDRLKG